jgi:ribose-phosphate pyrophosphokinase
MQDRFSEHFITPEAFEDIKKVDLSGPNGWLLFVACNSGADLARQVTAEYGKMLAENGSALREIPVLGVDGDPVTRMFDDTETCPRMAKHVAGSDAFVFQCVHDLRSGRSVNENIQQLLQVARTLRAHRAKTITVVLPYIPYARQDKPTFMRREATLASLFADQLHVAGVDIVVTYHPHTMSLDGFYEPAMKFVALSGLDLFVDIFHEWRGRKDLFAISTDAGGAKFTVHFARGIDIEYAITSKIREPTGETKFLGVIGDLDGKKIAVMTDDETVSGGSILKAVRALHRQYGIDETHVAVSHAKIVPDRIPEFVAAHEKHGLARLHVTDSVPQVPELTDLDFVVVHPLARRFATTVNRLHYNQSVSELFYRL